MGPDILYPILSHQKEAGRSRPWLGLQDAGKAHVPGSGSRSVFSVQLSSPPPSTSGASGGCKAVASILKHAGSRATTSTAFHEPQEDVADVGAACPPTHPSRRPGWADSMPRSGSQAHPGLLPDLEFPGASHLALPAGVKTDGP